MALGLAWARLLIQAHHPAQGCAQKCCAGGIKRWVEVPRDCGGMPTLEYSQAGGAKLGMGLSVEPRRRRHDKPMTNTHDERLLAYKQRRSFGNGSLHRPSTRQRSRVWVK